jgi:hypothetical protein
MMHSIPYGSLWLDPGATAIDDVDGDITQDIQTYGAAAVDTNVPTPEESPGYVVEYSVADSSGNAAPLVRRLIRVMCAAPERVCRDPEDNRLTCTFGGVCSKSLSAMGMMRGVDWGAAARSNVSQ